jgi:hypothetical protein
MMERPEKSIPNKSRKRIVPTARDVVMGRGKSIDLHPGNVSFRKLIAMHRTSYKAGNNVRHKRSIAELVLAKVIDCGGRFLNKGKGGFHIISMCQAIEKIKQALREKQTNKIPAAPQRKSAAQKEIISKVVKPTTRDVITDVHCENIAFQRLIGAHRSAYQVASSQLKPSIAKLVMDQVIDSGGRFLRADNHGGGFHILSLQQARGEITRALQKPTKTLVVPRRKSVSQNDIAAKDVEVVKKEATTQLLQLKKEASPVDMYLHEAIKVLDDEPDDDGRRTIPTIHCQIHRPNVCSSCRLAFFPFASFVAPMAGQVSYAPPAPCNGGIVSAAAK